METYKIDFTTKTLTITKAFAEAAADPNSAEYKLIQRFQRDIPNLSIVRKTHKTPTKYRTKRGDIFKTNPTKNLSFVNMERFISALSNSEELMAVYDYLRYQAGPANPSTYATVCQWFVEQFPQYHSKPLSYYHQQVDVIDITKFFNKETITEKGA